MKDQLARCDAEIAELQAYTDHPAILVTMGIIESDRRFWRNVYESMAQQPPEEEEPRND